MPIASNLICLHPPASKIPACCVTTVLCALALLIAAESNAANVTTKIAAAYPQELLLAVAINGHDLAESALILRGTDGRLLARGEDLLRWRLRVPADGAVSFDGESFYGLDALAGLSYQVDESKQALAIAAPAALFSSTHIAGSAGRLVEPTASQLGGFINYDVFVSSETDRTAVNGLIELGGFNAGGVGVTSFLGKDSTTGARAIRLASTWTRDHPAEMTSVRIGDLISSSGSWGRPVRFGGVQFATNFATQPGFVTFPLPAMAGEAVLPSTLELYVNNALRMRRDIPAGPFSIEDMPVLTGQGEAKIVVTDLLGRQQVIAAAYYASPTLLQKGLRAYSYEAGAIRQNFGIISNDYGRLMAAGTYRAGLTDRFTGEVHAELLEEQQAAGLGAVLLWPAVGVFSASVAFSHDELQLDESLPQQATRDGGTAGDLLGIAFQGQTDWVSYGASIQVASRHFTQMGLEPGQPAARRTGQAFFGASSRNLGSLSMSYVHQEPRDADRIELASGNYGTMLGSFGFLSVSVLRVLGADAEFVFGLNFTRLMGGRTTASVNATKTEDRLAATVRMQRNLPMGPGMGYRLAAGLGDSDRHQAAVSLQNDMGAYTVEADRSRGQTSYRGGASGGVALLGGDAFVSRRINSSFAVVQVPGYADVGIYQENQPVARTNARGNALITRLRPYEINSLRIEQADLPLDARIESLELKAVPYLRSGLLLSFPVQRSRGAVLTIVLDDGESLPAGAIGKLNADDEEIPVGFQGRIYVTGLNATNRIALTWRRQQCTFSFAFPESGDPLPDLGTYTCHGVKK